MPKDYTSCTGFYLESVSKYVKHKLLQFCPHTFCCFETKNFQLCSSSNWIVRFSFTINITTQMNILELLHEITSVCWEKKVLAPSQQSEIIYSKNQLNILKFKHIYNLRIPENIFSVQESLFSHILITSKRLKHGNCAKYFNTFTYISYNFQIHLPDSNTSS